MEEHLCQRSFDCCKTLSTNLKDNASFLNFNFYATLISTTDFSDHDYVYF